MEWVKKKKKKIKWLNWPGANSQCSTTTHTNKNYLLPFLNATLEMRKKKKKTKPHSSISKKNYKNFLRDRTQVFPDMFGKNEYMNQASVYNQEWETAI